MKVNQKGFSVVEVLTVVVIVGLIGAVGWLVYDRQNNKSSNQQTTNNATPKENSQSEVAKFTDCHTEVDKVSNTLSSGMTLYEWTTIEHTRVLLSDWNVTLAVPESMVGKAVCRYTSNGYEFSTRAIVNDDKCVTYYRTNEVASEGVQIGKYPASTAAEGQISGASGTLEDYYNARKASDGNYFTDPGAGRNYYKVGGNFYVAFGDAKGALDRYKSARSTACKNETPDFTKQFVDAMPTLKQN